MRRLVALAAVAGVALAVPVGCVRTYVNEPLTRQEQVSGRSEDVRQVDQPLHWGRDAQDKPDANVTPTRFHGGIE